MLATERTGLPSAIVGAIEDVIVIALAVMAATRVS
jgi:hypothetical protein